LGIEDNGVGNTPPNLVLVMVLRSAEFTKEIVAEDDFGAVVAISKIVLN